MKSILTVLTASILYSLVLTNNGEASDKEWRRFGEAAAVYLGVRALTGWDPVGNIVEYPRNRLRQRKEVVYKQPVGVYLQENRCNRISAFPCNHSGNHSHGQAQPYSQKTDRRNRVGYLSSHSEPSQGYNQPEQPQYSSHPLPPQKTSKPPVQIEKRIEGDYEIQTKRMWIEAHWESKTIDGHWRGDTWVETHTEKKWVEGQWSIEEEKFFLGESSQKNGPRD